MSVVPIADLALNVADLGKTYGTHGAKPVFSGLSFQVSRSGRLAVLGRNGQGKSTLIKILGGVLPQTEGRVEWRTDVSWPIGFGGGFQGSLSGLDNIRFLSRVYEKDYQEMLARVDDFAELGSRLKVPVKHYSSGMRARLAFGLSLAIDFDCYLIDELVAVGDSRFQAKCNAELFQHRADRAYIMASHDMTLIAEHCDRALVIESGQAKMFDDVGEAIDVYRWLRSA